MGGNGVDDFPVCIPLALTFVTCQRLRPASASTSLPQEKDRCMGQTRTATEVTSLGVTLNNTEQYLMNKCLSSIKYVINKNVIASFLALWIG